MTLDLPLLLLVALCVSLVVITAVSILVGERIANRDTTRPRPTRARVIYGRVGLSLLPPAAIAALVTDSGWPVPAALLIALGFGALAARHGKR